MNITIVDDMDRESCENFTVVLSTSHQSVIILSPSTSTVIIYDNEGLLLKHKSSSSVTRLYPVPFSIEPRIEYINNTPDVTGPNITAEFQVEGCINQTMCRLGRNGEPFACELLYPHCLHA